MKLRHIRRRASTRAAGKHWQLQVELRAPWRAVWAYCRHHIEMPLLQAQRRRKVAMWWEPSPALSRAQIKDLERIAAERGYPPSPSGWADHYHGAVRATDP